MLGRARSRGSGRLTMASRPGSSRRRPGLARRSGRCRWRRRTGNRRAPRCRVRRWMGIHVKTSCGRPHALWGCARARVRTLAALPFHAIKGLRGCRPAAGETGVAWSTPGWCGYHSEDRLDGAYIGCKGCASFQAVFLSSSLSAVQPNSFVVLPASVASGQCLHAGVGPLLPPAARRSF